MATNHFFELEIGEHYRDDIDTKLGTSLGLTLIHHGTLKYYRRRRNLATLTPAIFVTVQRVASTWRAFNSLEQTWTVRFVFVNRITDNVDVDVTKQNVKEIGDLVMNDPTPSIAALDANVTNVLVMDVDLDFFPPEDADVHAMEANLVASVCEIKLMLEVNR